MIFVPSSPPVRKLRNIIEPVAYAEDFWNYFDFYYQPLRPNCSIKLNKDYDEFDDFSVHFKEFRCSELLFEKNSYGDKNLR